MAVAGGFRLLGGGGMSVAVLVELIRLLSARGGLGLVVVSLLLALLSLVFVEALLGVEDAVRLQIHISVR